MERLKNRIEIASDVSTRDGVGIEVYQDDHLLLEIFRDDTQRTRTITLYSNEVSLEFMEENIRVFKETIPWDFIDYSTLSGE